ncbi:hypothetical protein KC725_06030, partial [Candidatus Peregrinibacteria bacterium]|nr:hypothetical protein [Candidatus Peregrinibacteria bacterium]
MFTHHAAIVASGNAGTGVQHHTFSDSNTRPQFQLSYNARHLHRIGTVPAPAGVRRLGLQRSCLAISGRCSGGSGCGSGLA